MVLGIEKAWRKMALAPGLLSRQQMIMEAVSNICNNAHIKLIPTIPYNPSSETKSLSDFGQNRGAYF
jgi:hypothetical protein